MFASTEHRYDITPATRDDGEAIERVLANLVSLYGRRSYATSELLPPEGQPAEIAAAIAALAKPSPSPMGEGYQEAFYAISKALGLSAMPVSPKEAFETIVLPRIEQLSADNERLRAAGQAALDLLRANRTPGKGPTHAEAALSLALAQSPNGGRDDG
jgi:hypothetical protein